MASQASRLGLRVGAAILICFVAFYVGRPLYWKLSATLQEVREKNYDANSVRDGFAQLMHSAQKRVGWINDESDAGVNEQPAKKSPKKPTMKRILKGIQISFSRSSKLIVGIVATAN